MTDNLFKIKLSPYETSYLTSLPDYLKKFQEKNARASKRTKRFQVSAYDRRFPSMGAGGYQSGVYGQNSAAASNYHSTPFQYPNRGTAFSNSYAPYTAGRETSYMTAGQYSNIPQQPNAYPHNYPSQSASHQLNLPSPASSIPNQAAIDQYLSSYNPESGIQPNLAVDQFSGFSPYAGNNAVPNSGYQPKGLGEQARPYQSMQSNFRGASVLGGSTEPFTVVANENGELPANLPVRLSNYMKQNTKIEKGQDGREYIVTDYKLNPQLAPSSVQKGPFDGSRYGPNGQLLTAPHSEYGSQASIPGLHQPYTGNAELPYSPQHLPEQQYTQRLPFSPALSETAAPINPYQTQSNSFTSPYHQQLYGHQRKTVDGNVGPGYYLPPDRSYQTGPNNVPPANYQNGPVHQPSYPTGNTPQQYETEIPFEPHPPIQGGLHNPDFQSVSYRLMTHHSC